MHKAIAFVVSGMFGCFAMLFGIANILVLVSAIADGVANQYSFAAFALYMIAPVLAGLSAFGIWRKKSWGRWTLLVISLLCVVQIPLIAPDAVALYRHFTSPPPNAYVTLTQSQFFDALSRLFFAPILYAAISIASTAWAFHYFKSRQKRGL